VLFPWPESRSSLYVIHYCSTNTYHIPRRLRSVERALIWLYPTRTAHARLLIQLDLRNWMSWRWEITLPRPSFQKVITKRYMHKQYYVNTSLNSRADYAPHECLLQIIRLVWLVAGASYQGAYRVRSISSRYFAMVSTVQRCPCFPLELILRTTLVNLS
jgi:hypothetical protein